jgi:hypothetical protein
VSDQWGVSQSQPRSQSQPQPQPQQPGHVASTPYGGAYAGAPYNAAEARTTTNGAALAGAILSVLPPLGFVLSIVGLSRAKALGGAGRTAAGVGIVLSLVFAGGYGIGIFEFASSATVDPACTSVLATESRLSAAESALTTVGSNGGGGDTQSELGTMASQLQTLESSLAEDAARAAQADVRARIQVVDGDLDRMIVDVKAIEGGDDSALSGLQGVARQLQTDGEAMDDVCGVAGQVGVVG